EARPGAVEPEGDRRQPEEARSGARQPEGDRRQPEEARSGARQSQEDRGEPEDDPRQPEEDPRQAVMDLLERAATLAACPLFEKLAPAVVIRLAERARASELLPGERRTTEDTVWIVARG